MSNARLSDLLSSTDPDDHLPHLRRECSQAAIALTAGWALSSRRCVGARVRGSSHHDGIYLRSVRQSTVK
jgi:hypothetical protein